MGKHRLGEFQEWLRSQGFQDSTVGTYTRSLRKALEKSDPTSALRKGDLSSGGRTVIAASLKLYAEFVGGGTGEELLKLLGSLPRRKPRQSVPERPLTDEEWKRLRGSLEEENEALWAVLSLLCRTGLRVRADIGRIEREKAEEGLKTGTLWLKQKGGRYRPYPVKNIRKELQTLLEYEDWNEIWQTLSGASLDSYYMIVVRGLKRCARRANLDPKAVHCHLLRKTVATELLRRTRGNIVGVQKMLGHKDIKTTQRYVAYTDPDELEEYSDLLEEE